MRRIFFAVTFCICLLVAMTSYAQTTQSLVEYGLKAVIEDGFEAFRNGGTDFYRETVKKENFKKVVDAAQKNLKGGYKLEFLGTLKARDKEMIHEIWKVSFANGEPDLLVRIWVKDGKYNAFWFHWQ